MSIIRPTSELRNRLSVWAGLAACLLVGGTSSVASGQSAGTSRSDAPKVSMAIEDEVLENLRGQELGPATVRDLKLPEPFLRRVADRVIRTTFRERYRVVIAQPNLPAQGAQSAPAGESTGFSAIGQAAGSNEVETSGDRASVGSRLAWIVGGFVVGLAVVYVSLLRRGRRG